LSPSLPQHLVRFIRNDIHSVLQLEVLLLLRERGGDWSAGNVADELRVTPHSAEAHLRDLARCGLLRYEVAVGGYAYVRDDPRLSSLVDELSDQYLTMRHAVINLIHPGVQGPG
jgi:hypothetical protein